MNQKHVRGLAAAIGLTAAWWFGVPSLTPDKQTHCYMTGLFTQGAAISRDVGHSLEATLERLSPADHPGTPEDRQHLTALITWVYREHQTPPAQLGKYMQTACTQGTTPWQ